MPMRNRSLPVWSRRLVTERRSRRSLGVGIAIGRGGIGAIVLAYLHEQSGTYCQQNDDGQRLDTHEPVPCCAAQRWCRDRWPNSTRTTAPEGHFDEIPCDFVSSRGPSVIVAFWSRGGGDARGAFGTWIGYGVAHD